MMQRNKNLINQLREFGLNPKYWILKELNPVKKQSRWMITHKKDKDLCLLGATEGNTGWAYLEWRI